MFWNNFKFRVLVYHSDKAVADMKTILLDKGVTVYDLQEADLISNSDKSIIDKGYVLCCRSSRRRYEYIKTRFNYQELKHENYKTLI